MLANEVPKEFEHWKCKEYLCGDLSGEVYSLVYFFRKNDLFSIHVSDDGICLLRFNEIVLDVIFIAGFDAKEFHRHLERFFEEEAPKHIEKAILFVEQQASYHHPHDVIGIRLVCSLCEEDEIVFDRTRDIYAHFIENHYSGAFTKRAQ